MEFRPLAIEYPIPLAQPSGYPEHCKVVSVFGRTESTADNRKARQQLHIRSPPMSTQVSKRKKFVADGVFRAELNDFFTRELSEEGYSGCDVRVTHARTEVNARVKDHLSI